MRRRYTVLKLAPEPLSLYPFRLWANFSESDRQSCRALFSTYIKGDIHRLLSVLATFMPIGIWPDRTPIEFLDDALDVTEVKDAIENIRDDELTREERVVLHRVWDAFNGIYMKGSEFPDSLSRFKEESDQYLKVYDIDHSSVQTSPTWPFKDMFQMEDPV